MNATSRPTIVAASGTALLAMLAAASSPSVFSEVDGGEWEISRSGAQPVKLCVADPAALAQFEHRNSSCTREIVRESGSGLTINYTCARGEFGHSTVTVVTPRSLRIETQGISGNAPFKYVFQARRVGNCGGH